MSYFIIVILLVVIYGIFLYNRLIALQQSRKNSFADISVQLKLRHDLIPNLIETVKRYIEHEKELLENITNARSKAMQAETVSEKSDAESFLESSMMNLLAVSENYPELKADNNFNRFQGELSALEKAIAASRRFFNNSTAEFNTAIGQVPANIIAKIFGFHEETFFELDEDKKLEMEDPPVVKF